MRSQAAHHRKVKQRVIHNKFLRIQEDVGGFLTSSGKKLSTLIFLFSWQNKTFLLTENQRTLLRSQFNFFFIFLSSSLTFLGGSQNFVWNFSAAPKRCKNLYVLDTLLERDISWVLFFLNPYDFT